MAGPDHGNREESQQSQLKLLSEWVRQINRPQLVGNSPSKKAERAAYVFTQKIRSFAGSSGVPGHLMSNIMVSIEGVPNIPKPKEMAEVFVLAKSYIRGAEATHEAEEFTLHEDEGGRILIAKSKSFPHRISFRFLPRGRDSNVKTK